MKPCDVIHTGGARGEGRADAERETLMSRRVLFAIVGLALMALSVHAEAQVNEEAFTVLRKKIMANGMVSFSGLRTVVLFENGVKVRGFQEQIYQKSPGKQRIAVVAPEGERGRLCVTNGQVQWQYFPKDSKAVRRELSTAAESRASRLAGLDRLRERMKIEYLGTETIAGRSAHVILVSAPLDIPIKKTWVDSQHYIPLKTQLFDSSGNVKSSAFYTAINFRPQYTAGMFDFELPPGCSVRTASQLPKRMSQRAAEKAAGFRAALPRYLPPGYSLLKDQVAVLEQGGKVILWVPFSNGADTFSIFQRLLGSPAPPPTKGRSLTWNLGNHSFVLVGSISVDQMKRVRDSLSF